MNRVEYSDSALPGRLRQTQPAYSIVIPVYNEEPILTHAVSDLYKALESRGAFFELLLCENGSTDNTKTAAKQIANEFDRVNVYSLKKADYGAAIRAGILKANAPYVFVFDIDYYDVGFLDRALKLLPDYDIVIASKTAEGSSDKRNFARRIITRGFSFFVTTVFNTSTGETHGMKAFKCEAIDPIIAKTRSSKDLFDTELIIRGERAGLKIIEIPVTVEEKRPTRSSILKRIPRTVAGLATLRFALWREGSS